MYARAMEKLAVPSSATENRVLVSLFRSRGPAVLAGAVGTDTRPSRDDLCTRITPRRRRMYRAAKQAGTG